LGSLVQEANVPPQPELIAQTVNLLAFIVRTVDGRRVSEMLSVDGFHQQDGFKLNALGGPE
jgi:type IV secretion system protein VirB11